MEILAPEPLILLTSGKYIVIDQHSQLTRFGGCYGARKGQQGHTYFDGENIRVTAIPKIWNGDSGIPIQAYKEGGGLHPGAEMPVPDKDTAFDLLKGVHLALEQNKL